MPLPEVTCGMEIQSVLKILIIIDLVKFILWCLVDILAGIVIVVYPSSTDPMIEFFVYVYAEKNIYFNTEYELNVFGWSLIIVSVLVLLMRISLFLLIYTGLKKKSYTKCLIWFVIYVVLEILRVGRVIRSILIKETDVDVFIWSVLALFNFYLLIVAFIYLRDLKREIFGGTQNTFGTPRNNQVVFTSRD